MASLPVLVRRRKPMSGVMRGHEAKKSNHSGSLCPRRQSKVRLFKDVAAIGRYAQ